MGVRERSSKAAEKIRGSKGPPPSAFQTAPSGAKGPKGVRGKPRPTMCCFLVLLLLALAMCTRPCSSALFEDASAASDFGSNLLLSTPWAGYPYSVRRIDLDADGVDEILVGGYQFACSGRIYQLSLFARDPSSNRYVQRDYGRDRFFLGLDFHAFYFEPLRRTGSALPDIVACSGATNRLAVLSNHGALNFSISSTVDAANISCHTIGTAMAVSDTDHDGNDDLFVSSYRGTYFWTYLPNGTLASAASRFPSLPLLNYPAATFGRYVQK